MIEWIDPVLLALGLVVAVGAFVQSSIGFGIAVVSAPFVVVLRPELMPTSMLVCAFVLPVLQLATGPREISWRPLGWAAGTLRSSISRWVRPLMRSNRRSRARRPLSSP